MYNAIFFLEMTKNVRFLEVDNITIKLVLVQITDYLRIVTITDFLSSTLDLSHAPWKWEALSSSSLFLMGNYHSVVM